MYAKGCPQYCCYFQDGNICLGLVCDESLGLVYLLTEEGDSHCLSARRMLFCWQGEMTASAESEAMWQKAALEQLEEKKQQHQELLEGRLSAEERGALERLHGGLIAGQGLEAAELLEVLSAGEQGWEGARWYWVLLRGKEWFRRQKGEFVVLSTEEGVAVRKRAAVRWVQQQQVQRTQAWVALLKQGKWPPPVSDSPTSSLADEPETASLLQPSAVTDPQTTDWQPQDLLAALQSLLVAEQASPHWALLGLALGLTGLEKAERERTLQQWLQHANCWPGWPSIWMRRAQVHSAFPKHLQAAADTLAQSPRETGTQQGQKRSKPWQKLHMLHSYTIDASSTRDYDDAIAIEAAAPDRVQVAVSIAAPAALIPARHSLTKEAICRTSTFYHPAGCVPMLPAAISENRSSLLAQQERETITFRLEVIPRGVQLLELLPGVVSIQQNLNYQQSAQLLQEDRSWGLLAGLCQQQAQRRQQAGARLHERHELLLDASDPQAVKLHHIQRSDPIHRLVEELAISCNIAAADYCHQHQIPVLYRTQAASPPACDDASPSAATKQPIQAVRLSLTAAEHASIGCPRYIQLTAPLRRALDLCLQQQLLAHLCGQPLPWQAEELQQLIPQLESRLGVLQRLSRRLETYWKMVWLQQHSHQNFTAKAYKATHRGETRVWLPQLQMPARLHGNSPSPGEEVPVRLEALDMLTPRVWVKRDSYFAHGSKTLVAED